MAFVALQERPPVVRYAAPQAVVSAVTANVSLTVILAARGRDAQIFAVPKEHQMSTAARLDQRAVGRRAASVCSVATGCAAHKDNPVSTAYVLRYVCRRRRPAALDAVRRDSSAALEDTAVSMAKFAVMVVAPDARRDNRNAAVGAARMFVAMGSVVELANNV